MGQGWPTDLSSSLSFLCRARDLSYSLDATKPAGGAHWTCNRLFCPGVASVAKLAGTLLQLAAVKGCPCFTGAAGLRHVHPPHSMRWCLPPGPVSAGQGA